MTIVLGAMDEEITSIRDGMQVAHVETWHGHDQIFGSISGEDVVLCRTGVGKTLSAMVCQHLIHRVSPDRVVFTGVAGALADDLEIGDTIIARDCIQHDMDATPLGMRPGEIPYSGYCLIACDPDLVARAEQVAPISGSARVGRVLTGDQFVTDPAVKEELRNRFDGDCVEMEGASVALVCAANETPCILIRTISDHADGTVDFQRALSVATRNSWHYVSTLLAAVTGSRE